jgi:chemotaxis signal transduction protein
VETVFSEPALYKAGKYLTFRVARQDFVLNINCVRGILPVHQLIPIESDYANRIPISGFAAVGGLDFPVIDLRAKLGIPHGSHGREPFIIVVETGGLWSGGRLAGFIADRVSDMLDLRPRDFRNGMLRTHGRPRRVLVPDRIMNEEDWSAFALDLRD